MALYNGGSPLTSLAMRRKTMQGTLTQPPNIAPAAQPNIAPTARPMAQPMVLPRPPKPTAPGLTPQFGPGNDLRFSQIDPTASTRLSGLQGQVSGAAGRIAGGPDLTSAAQEKLRLFEEQGEPGFQKALQAVGRKAGALGRLGAGMTTSELGDVASLRERDISQARRGLASDLAFAEGGERRANLGALSGLESQVFGQEQGARGELRGERGYQADTAQQALENRIRQRMLEESLTEGAFGRQATRAQLGLQGAGLYGEQAAQSGATAADLLQELALQETLRRTGRQPTVARPYGEAPG